DPLFFLPLDLAGHGADDEGHGQHGEEGQRVAGDGEVHGPVGVGEGVIDENDAEEGGGDAVDVSVGEPGHQDYHQREDHGGEPAGVVHDHQQSAEQSSQRQKSGGDQDVPQDVP